MQSSLSLGVIYILHVKKFVFKPKTYIPQRSGKTWKEIVKNKMKNENVSSKKVSASISIMKLELIFSG